MRRFIATSVAAANVQDLNALVVLFAENPDGSGARLELQRALSFDAQDCQLSHDTYCLSTETGATYYGGVRFGRWKVLG